MKNRLLAFLSGKGKGPKGLYISDVHKFSFEQLESNHNYIQWLFPIKTISVHNLLAPIYKESVDYNTPIIMDNIKKSFEMMLRFYGLEYQNSQIVRRKDFEKTKQWVTYNNHNYLRITRILKSLMLFQMGKEAKTFFTALEKIYEENKDIISEKTYLYWKMAIKE